MKNAPLMQSYSSHRDARARRTGAAMRNALLALLGRKSFDEITIREITSVAGIGYATFFRHYASKDALLDTIAMDEIDQLAGMALPIFDAVNSRESCIALCFYIDSQRTLWSILLTGGAAGAMRESFITVCARIAQLSRPLPPWLPRDIGVAHIAGSIIEIFAWWLRQPKPLPIERIAEILDRAVISPLVAG